MKVFPAAVNVKSVEAALLQGGRTFRKLCSFVYLSNHFILNISLNLQIYLKINIFNILVNLTAIVIRNRKVDKKIVKISLLTSLWLHHLLYGLFSMNCNDVVTLSLPVK